MKIKINFFCLTIIFSSIVLSDIQGAKYPIYDPTPDKATADKLLSRPLVIETMELTEKERNKLLKNDPETLNYWETYNSYYNSSLEYYFKNKKAGNKEVILMNSASIDSLRKIGSSQYAILRGLNMKRCFSASGKELCKDTYSFVLYLSEEKDKKLIVSFIEDVLTDSDFIFLVQQINNVLNNASKNLSTGEYNELIKNFPEKVKDKILLVPESILSEKLTKEEIQSAYALPIEFVNENVYEEKIKNESKNYIYMVGNFVESLHGYACVVVNAENGEVILAIGSGGVTFYVAAKPKKTKLRYTMEERNKAAITLLEIKPKFKIKKSYFSKIMDYAKGK